MIGEALFSDGREMQESRGFFQNGQERKFIYSQYLPAVHSVYHSEGDSPSLIEQVTLLVPWTLLIRSPPVALAA